MAVRVQAEDFDLGDEVSKLTDGNTDIGAIVTFVGVVRDTTNGALLSMELEHYPAMTKQALETIDQAAAKRWSLNASMIIHRYGDLAPGAQIMMVATASPHRKDAFEAAEFLMDYLKTDAPFWKKESTPQGERWVDARQSDQSAVSRWAE